MTETPRGGRWRATGDAILGWALLAAIPAVPAAVLWWVATRYPGWPVADAVISLVAIGWLYWLTNRQQRHLGRVEALERRDQEQRHMIADLAARLGLKPTPGDDYPDTDEIPAQRDTVEMAEAWDTSAAQLSTTVTREVGGHQFRFREGAQP